MRGRKHSMLEARGWLSNARGYGPREQGRKAHAGRGMPRTIETGKTNEENPK